MLPNLSVDQKNGARFVEIGWYGAEMKTSKPVAKVFDHPGPAFPRLPKSEPDALRYLRKSEWITAPKSAVE